MSISSATVPAADITAIRAVLAELVAAWNRADGAAYGALFTADADYIDVTGTRTQGGSAIGQLHQSLWATFLRGSTLESNGAEADIQLIGADVALVIAGGTSRLDGQAAAPDERQSINTTVLVRRDGAWRIRAFQNNRVQPLRGRPAGPAAGNANPL